MNAKMTRLLPVLLMFTVITAALISCSNSGDTLTQPDPDPLPENTDQYTIARTLADGGQLKTIAFDGLAFMTNNLGAQSFLPPGKVADFCGFQYLRDNDPTEMGHNTDFVTIIAFNIVDLLSQDQLNSMIDAARRQVDLINEYAYKRFPLMHAFRRLLENDLPQGTTELDRDKVVEFSKEIYQIDGQISYERAELLGSIVRSLTPEQTTALSDLKNRNGIGNWDNTQSDPLSQYHLPKEVNVVVMTLASEMYSWYAGSVEADTYFCPERQGTYFGSFYLKDWPAMGNPNYTIDEQLTARAGEEFLNILTEDQKQIISSLVDEQKIDLNEIVDCRQNISTELRKFIVQETINRETVLSLSEKYGAHDGAIVYHYAVQFTETFNLLNDSQRAELRILVENIGYVHPDGAFLYSDPINMPAIIDTDFFFK